MANDRIEGIIDAKGKEIAAKLLLEAVNGSLALTSELLAQDMDLAGIRENPFSKDYTKAAIDSVGDKFAQQFEALLITLQEGFDNFLQSEPAKKYKGMLDGEITALNDGAKSGDFTALSKIKGDKRALVLLEIDLEQVGLGKGGEEKAKEVEAVLSGLKRITQELAEKGGINFITSFVSTPGNVDGLILRSNGEHTVEELINYRRAVAVEVAKGMGRVEVKPGGAVR